MLAMASSRHLFSVPGMRPPTPPDSSRMPSRNTFCCRAVVPSTSPRTSSISYPGRLSMVTASMRRRLARNVSVRIGEPSAQLLETVREKPRHVHLGDPDLGRDLRLGHVAE